MTTKDFTANVISATKVVPDGNFKDSKASGIWDINEALDLIKGGNWPNVANINPAAFVDGLFQTHLYTGTGSAQTITNGIDLSGKGGLVWIKDRGAGFGHNLFDTARGVGKYINSDGTAAEATDTTRLSAFNSNGFSLGSQGSVNTNTNSLVSWTFRKQPKFFDIVKYTGDGSNGRAINHNLGSVPGMIIIKILDTTDHWTVYHRGMDSSQPEDYRLRLNDTAARNDSPTFADTAPTSTQFTVGAYSEVNGNGNDFIAYLFAHNNDDGGFGEHGDQDIIKCGSYTGNGSTQSISLGFEPQFIILKSASSAANWVMLDNMRGVVTSSDAADDQYLFPNLDTTEGGGIPMNFTATGFDLANEDTSNKNNDTFIYMAIRRGGMQTPTTPSDVFHVQSQSDGDTYSVGFPTDLALVYKRGGSSANTYVGSRLTGNDAYFVTSTDAAEASSSNLWNFNLQNSFDQGASTSAAWVGWHWARARGYFDVVTYTGTGSARTVTHNLGVVPEMMWIKNRDASENWPVYHKGLDGGTNPETHYIRLNQTNAEADSADWWNDTAPTASVFTVGTQGQVNTNTENYIAWLFATVAGVSKVGAFQGDGGDVTVDCGFTNGCKFILYKDTGGSHWRVFDSVRGINSGADPTAGLNLTSAELTTSDLVDPTSSGFTAISTSANSYIFYAIANDPS